MDLYVDNILTNGDVGYSVLGGVVYGNLSGQTMEDGYIARIVASGTGNTMYIYYYDNAIGGFGPIKTNDPLSVQVAQVNECGTVTYDTYSFPYVPGSEAYELVDAGLVAYFNSKLHDTIEIVLEVE